MVGGVHPVGGGVELHGGAGDRHEFHVRRALACFDESDAAVGVLREPGRDDRAGGSGAYYDEIERIRHVHLVSLRLVSITSTSENLWRG